MSERLKKVKLLGAAVIILALLLAACQQTPADAPSEPAAEDPSAVTSEEPAEEPVLPKRGAGVSFGEVDADQCPVRALPERVDLDRCEGRLPGDRIAPRGEEPFGDGLEAVEAEGEVTVEPRVPVEEETLVPAQELADSGVPGLGASAQASLGEFNPVVVKTESANYSYFAYVEVFDADEVAEDGTGEDEPLRLAGKVRDVPEAKLSGGGREGADRVRKPGGLLVGAAVMQPGEESARKTVPGAGRVDRLYGKCRHADLLSLGEHGASFVPQLDDNIASAGFLKTACRRGRSSASRRRAR